MPSRRQFLAAFGSALPPHPLLAAPLQLPLAPSDWFEAHGHRYQVIVRGSGPVVVVLHEITGPTRQFAEFVDWLVAERFEVHCPVFFGTFGMEVGRVAGAKYFASACFRGQFECGHPTRPSPLHAWLVAYCRQLARQGQDAIGVVGMCLTGIMPLAAMRAANVVAPVLCQPALPMHADLGQAIGLPASDVDLVRWRLGHEHLTILLLRYRTDPLSPPERSATLQREFGAHVDLRQFEGGGHSTLVHSPHADARRAVATFLTQRLARTGRA